ncbi:MAG: Tol-Pal system beta propeller repeat protein TolB [Gammaproteobacteria bacterium]|nr:Tol-Pal system beta propeller repeat protein TolB [Gammaproteobacteria bacterium]
MRMIFRAVLLYLTIGASAAQAALTIEITQGMEGAMPIAVVPFGWTGSAAAAPENIAAIISSDLSRSGRFEPLPDRDLVAHPTNAEQVQFHNWRMLNVDNLVIGQVTETGAGGYNIQFQLFDVYRGKQLIGQSFPTSHADLRRAAHHISDLIYKELTGEPGAFNTRIAYVTTADRGAQKSYTLLVADSDGYNPQTILHSSQPLMSPAWSSDGKRVAYVSFENKTAEIYIQDVASSTRRKLASFKGINGAPAWSPDGRRLALTLSRDGNPEIYTMDLASLALKRLTSNAAIDTEPAWSPDSRSLVFTSDRGGSPQLYRIAASGGQAQRLTFEGKYNAGADFSPDGRKLAMVHAEGGAYRIAVLDLDTSLLRVLTDGQQDESPSFSPNGSMIIYATGTGNREVLAAVSVDGRFRQRLSLQAGNVREPAWSPVAGK